MTRALLAVAAALLLLASCEGVDCTLNNTVALRVGLYKSGTDSLLLVPDTLSVTAFGTDSVLLNRATRTAELTLPMSYWQEADTLCLTLYGDDYETDDYLVVKKTNTEHYESPDCPATMFHVVTGVGFRSPYGTVDSVVVVKPTVNYDPQENLRIYLRPRRVAQ